MVYHLESLASQSVPTTRGPSHDDTPCYPLNLTIHSPPSRNEQLE